MVFRKKVEETLSKIKLLGSQGKSAGAGVDISDATLKLLLLEEKSGKMETVFGSSYDLQENVVSDGRVLDKKSLAAGLSKLQKLAQEKGQEIGEITLTVPESKTFLHVFKLSATHDQEKLKKAVAEKAKSLIPFRPNEVYSDFVILNTKEGLTEILYAACPKKIVDDYLAMVQKVGLEIGALDMEAASLVRSLIPNRQKDEALIFDCGARTTTLTIYDRGGIRSINNLSIAGQAFTKSIAENLDLDSEKAEKFKKEKGLQGAKIKKALEPLLQSLYKQVDSYLSDYQADSGSKLESIIVCGGSALLPGFIPQMDQNFNLKVKRARPFENNLIRVREEMLREDFLENSLMYATVVGSALRATREKPEGIDLLPIK